MTMTDKPSPATLKPCPFCGGPAYVRDCSDEHSPEWQAGCEGANGGQTTCDMNIWASDIDEVGAVNTWNTRPLDLPSSCSSSHQEIRYTGDKCPLCEAMAVVMAAIAWSEAQGEGDDSPRGDLIAATCRYRFSRPSEAPALDHIFCGDSDDPKAICDRSDCDRPLSDHVREFVPKPGAGEEKS